MNKRKIAFSIILMLPVLACLVFVYQLMNEDRLYFSEKFEQKREAFEYVADYVVDMAEQYKKSDMEISMNVSNGKKIICILDDKKTIKPEINDELRENIDKIDETFWDGCWNKIIVTEQGVSFSIEGNNMAFVYTFDGNRPDYMNNPEERFNIKSWSLGEGWYYVEP